MMIRMLHGTLFDKNIIYSIACFKNADLKKHKWKYPQKVSEYY